MHFIHEYAIPGRRLGRHVNHDVRSLGFLHQRTRATVVTVTWARLIAILNQGSLGSCVGNAGVGSLGTQPIYTALPVDHPALDEPLAVDVYSAATQIDPFSGAYPPDDTGTDGVSVAKILHKRGLISGYTHCLDLPTALDALMKGPVWFGINWYSSFDTPDATGLISIAQDAYVRGGHEILARGVDADNAVVFCDNSWGADWGVNGSFRISFDTLTRLLSEGGDCTVPVPLSQPAPKPTPVLYTTDGTMSLVQISQKKGSPVSTILRTTLQQFKYYSSGTSHYLQAGNLNAAMPAGETLCLAWPQYSIG